MRMLKGVINCAINKNLLKDRSGVTEYLALKCNVPRDSGGNAYN